MFTNDITLNRVQSGCVEYVANFIGREWSTRLIDVITPACRLPASYEILDTFDTSPLNGIRRETIANNDKVRIKH
jgi:hypothetical protein